MNRIFENLHAKVQYGVRIYGLSKCRVKLYGEHNLNLAIILIISKEECEMYYRFGLGIITTIKLKYL
jgi:hypothetical protein